MLSVPFIAGLALSCTAVDGDTLRCRGAGLIRLVSIDAPELPGHCRRGRTCTPGDGAASRAALAALIRGKAVQCYPAGRDRYRRILAQCSAFIPFTYVVDAAI